MAPVSMETPSCSPTSVCARSWAAGQACPAGTAPVLGLPLNAAAALPYTAPCHSLGLHGCHQRAQHCPSTPCEELWAMRGCRLPLLHLLCSGLYNLMYLSPGHTAGSHATCKAPTSLPGGCSPVSCPPACTQRLHHPRQRIRHLQLLIFKPHQ